jgi:uncharacterized membrane protein
MAVFFIKVETEFFETYHNYYESISSRNPLEVIEEKRELMIRSLVNGLKIQIHVQGLISACFILLAPGIFSRFAIDSYTVGLVRIGILGAFFQILAFFTVIVMLYFEFYGQALSVAGLFLALNTVLARILMHFGQSWDGWCYPLAGAAAFVLGAFLLARSLRSLEYITFTNQPIPTLKNFDPSLFEGTGLGRFIKLKEAER